MDKPLLLVGVLGSPLILLVLVSGAGATNTGDPRTRANQRHQLRTGAREGVIDRSERKWSQ